MKDDIAYKYRLGIALQLSFIVWVILGIFMFYAIAENKFRMYGTFVLLFTVLLITPFLPDNEKYKDIKSAEDWEEN